MRYKIPTLGYVILFAVMHLALQVLFGVTVFFIEQNLGVWTGWVVNGIQFIISVGIICLLFNFLRKNRVVSALLVLGCSHILLHFIVFYLGVEIELEEVVYDIFTDIASVFVVNFIYSRKWLGDGVK